jgi:hypothetical protein
MIFRPAREVQDRRTLLFVDEQEREQGNYMLKVDKLMQPIGIVLLYFVGLSGFDYICGKKRAWLLHSGYDTKVGFVKREYRFGR